MFALPGIAVLIATYYLRLVEIIPALQKVPTVHTAFGLAVFGMLLDSKQRKTLPALMPQTAWVVAFLLWSALTVLVKAPDMLTAAVTELVKVFCIYIAIAFGLFSAAGLNSFRRILVMLTVFLCVNAMHLRSSPRQCIGTDPIRIGEIVKKPDGRSCNQPLDCYFDGGDPRLHYMCEHVGWFGATTVGNRVRYLGILQDPNELALFIAIVIPFAVMALSRRKKRTGNVRKLALAAIICLITAVVVFTRSRSGQLVIAAVLGVYFIRRYGAMGIFSTLTLGIPLFAIISSGRADAAASSSERMECWYEGVRLMMSSPIFGVGFRRFEDYHYLTAHNSYILTLAELGLPGAYLWLGVLFSSLKVAWTSYLRCAKDANEQFFAAFSFSTMASLIGMLVGMVFLSLSYHPLVWVHLALSGALQSTLRSSGKGWRVPFRLGDLFLLGIITGMITAVFFLVTHISPP